MTYECYLLFFSIDSYTAIKSLSNSLIYKIFKAIFLDKIIMNAKMYMYLQNCDFFVTSLKYPTGECPSCSHRSYLCSFIQIQVVIYFQINIKNSTKWLRIENTINTTMHAFAWVMRSGVWIQFFVNFLKTLKTEFLKS